MPVLQIVFGVALVLGLLAVAGATAWRQLVVLRNARDDGEEGRHERGRAVRRLIGSVVMLLLALMLLAAMIFLEEPMQKLVALGPIETDKPEYKEFKRLYGWFWVSFLLLLLVLLAVAAVDLWIVRRYGRRQMRRLQEERRAMVELQTERLRQERRREGG